MTVYDRLLMELSNQQYLSETQYKQALAENNLTPESEFDKTTMYKSLLCTVLDILEYIANDIDVMSTIKNEFTSISEAYEWLNDRIQKIRNKIAAIPEDDIDAETNQFSLMYTHGGVRTHAGVLSPISDETIRSIVKGA